MAKLIYASNMSLDGCTEDERGAFDWAPPDDDVFAFITELVPAAGNALDPYFRCVQLLAMGQPTRSFDGQPEPVGQPAPPAGKRGIPRPAVEAGI